MTALIVIAKEPVPGRVKTRLTPPYTPAQAARLAALALTDTLDAVLGTPVKRRVLAIAGTWEAPGFEVIQQRGDGLAERLVSTFADVGEPAVLIGMDTPQVTSEHLTAAIDALDTADAVYGPAADGGFWLLGLREPLPELAAVPMSRADTGEHLLTALRDRRVVELGTLTDVDTAEDAARVARQAPHTRFAAALA